VIPLGKLFRTTVFKVSLAYLVISAIGAGLVLGSVGGNIKILIDEQIAQTIDADISGLYEQFAQGGMNRLIASIEKRSRRPGAQLYLVTNPEEEAVAGNVTGLPVGVMSVFTEATFTSKSVSTSFLISCLLAFGFTANVMVFWNSIRPIAFSFVIG